MIPRALWVHLVSITILLIINADVSVACMKKFPEPTVIPITTVPPNVVVENCTINETELRSCMNGGICEVEIFVKTGSRASRCWCPAMYDGAMCQTRQAPPVNMAGTIAASIVAGVVLIVISVVILAVLRYRRKSNQPPSNEQNLTQSVNRAYDLYTEP